MTVVTSAEGDDGAGRRTTHHHGNLAPTLVAATADLVAAKGPAGFSLREVARQAGVSPAAPAHHFGNARGLLTAVAVQGFHYLDRTIAEATADVADPGDRLGAAALAYIDLGLRHPGHVAVMFRPDLVDQADDDYLREAGKPYRRLQQVIEELADDLAPDHVDASTQTLWAMLNGFVNLHTSTADRLDADPDLRGLATAAVAIFHHGVLATTG